MAFNDWPSLKDLAREAAAAVDLSGDSAALQAWVQRLPSDPSTAPPRDLALTLLSHAESTAVEHGQKGQLSATVSVAIHLAIGDSPNADPDQLLIDALAAGYPAGLPFYITEWLPERFPDERGASVRSELGRRARVWVAERAPSGPDPAISPDAYARRRAAWLALSSGRALSYSLLTFAALVMVASAGTLASGYWQELLLEIGVGAALFLVLVQVLPRRPTMRELLLEQLGGPRRADPSLGLALLPVAAVLILAAVLVDGFSKTLLVKMAAGVLVFALFDRLLPAAIDDTSGKPARVAWLCLVVVGLALIVTALPTGSTAGEIMVELGVAALLAGAILAVGPRGAPSLVHGALLLAGAALLVAAYFESASFAHTTMITAGIALLLFVALDTLLSARLFRQRIKEARGASLLFQMEVLVPHWQARAEVLCSLYGVHPVSAAGVARSEFDGMSVAAEIWEQQVYEPSIEQLQREAEWEEGWRKDYQSPNSADGEEASGSDASQAPNEPPPDAQKRD